MHISLVAVVVTAGLLSGCGALTELTGSDPAGLAATADPEKARGLYLKVIAGLQEQNKHHAALAYLDDIEKRYPGDARVLLMRAQSLVAIRRYAEAEPVYRGLTSSAYAAAAYNGLGTIFGAQQRWAEAEAAFRQAVALRPTQANFIGNLGYTLLLQDRLDEAQFLLHQAGELDPMAPEARTNLTLCLHRMGKTAQVSARLAALDADERHQVERLLAQWTPQAAAGEPRT